MSLAHKPVLPSFLQLIFWKTFPNFLLLLLLCTVTVPLLPLYLSELLVHDP